MTLPVIHEDADRYAVVGQLQALSLYVAALPDVGAIRLCTTVDALRRAVAEHDHHIIRRAERAVTLSGPVDVWARVLEVERGADIERALYRAGYYLRRADGQPAAAVDYQHARELLRRLWTEAKSR